MDPSHITEFASPKYFDKLRSLNSAANNAQPPDAQPGPAESSTFVLPIGNPRPPTARRRRSDDTVRSGELKKRSLGFDLTSLRTHQIPNFTSSIVTFRSKNAALKTQMPFLGHHESTSTEEPLQNSKLSLHDLFFSLPNELQVQIIAPLPFPTILNLRLASRSLHAMVSMNEAPLARYHLRNSVPTYALRLYPIPDYTDSALRHLCTLWHRLHVCARLSVLIAEHTTREIFLRDTEAKRLEFQPQFTRMRLRLMPLLFAIFHFFEKHRERHVQHLLEGGVPLRLQPFTLNPIERQIMEAYDDDTLLKVHQVFPLVLSTFSRRLRPPSYAGRLERSIKGYLKDKPADEIYASILFIGGLRQVEKFWAMKGYNTRRAAVDAWYSCITREPLAPTGKSSKLAMLTGLGRKKPSQEAQAPDLPVGDEGLSCSGWYCVKPSCSDARNHAPSTELSSKPSLATGPPMSPLPRDQLKGLLTDQQPLTSIWLHTAEAVILERNIVGSSRDIKRNTQVLLELIKEEGSAIDEEWAPGLSQALLFASLGSYATDMFSTVQYV